jgi:phosphoribosylglycinamide formyltransferase 1
MHDPIRLAVLLSRGGASLQNLIDRIAAGTLRAEIALVLSNKAEAFGLTRARQAGIPTVVVERGAHPSRQEFSARIFAHCREAEVDLVCLAGFLQLLHIAEDFQQRVINMHPALIPAFCGKGYYGLAVHRAVLDRGVKVSGCTVHFVDDEYDHGPIISQHVVPVLDDDTPESLAQRVFTAEFEAFPQAVQWFAQGRLRIEGGRVRLPNSELLGIVGKSSLEITSVHI